MVAERPASLGTQCLADRASEGLSRPIEGELANALGACGDQTVSQSGVAEHAFDCRGH
jgi:hypothetical protein